MDRLSALIVFLGLLPSPDTRPDLASDTPDPRALIALAQQGDVQAAVAGILRQSSSQALEGARALIADPTCSRACRQAAALVHTEARFTAPYSSRRAAEPAHLRAAEILVESLSEADARGADESGRELERRWRVTVGYGFQEWVGAQSATAAFEKVLARFPEDPEALVALGAIVEQAAAAPAFVGAQPLPGATWARAAGYYERALAVRPDHVEARLRLGHVAARRGREGDARRELAQVLAARPPAIVEALAHLFLGDIEARQSQMEAAVREYRTASAAEPRLQAASLSLAHVLLGAGRAQEAAALQLQALDSTQGRPAIGWSAYHTDLLHGYRASMDALWREARR